MKRISLYIEHGVGNGVGGAELMMAQLASAWSRDHDVELVHHRPPLTLERLSAFLPDDLSRVHVRCVPRDAEPQLSADPWRRFQHARDWHRQLSEGRDLFVACTHWAPPFNHAHRGVLLVLFPMYVRPQDSPEMRALPWLKRMRHRAWHDFEWRLRMRTYPRRVAISRYTQAWTTTRWRIDTDVVAPPVDVAFPIVEKRRQILCVGRYSTMAHTKKQLELAQTFRRLVDEGLTGWQFVCLGGLNTRAENHAYFESVRAVLDGYPATVAANVPYDAVRRAYAESTLFWHATGFGDDTDVNHPELAEHFGIAPVEAMAAGCVPMVVNKGGPADIVVDRVNGIRWNSLDDLASWTRLFAGDTALTASCAEAARRTAHAFSRERFVARMSAVCDVSWRPAPGRPDELDIMPVAAAPLPSPHPGRITS